MALSAKKQFLWWGTGLAILFVALWQLGDVLLPFVVGSALAYLLDPVADRLERSGMSRFWATAIISLVSLVAVVGVVIGLIPIIAGQLSELVAIVPEMTASLQAWVKQTLNRYAPGLLMEEFELLSTLQDFGGVIQTVGTAVVGRIFSIGFGAVNMVVFVLVVPVVMIYMLADWDLALEKIDNWLPRDHADDIRQLATDIDRALAGFVRGQLTVCLLLAAFYAVLLQLIGLQFGFTVGIVAGLLSFIPFVGAIVGGILAIGLALFQFWSEPLWVIAVAGIFGAGQILEGNVLTPKLVGKSIGLHPVWLLFALSAFGALFGFVGLLVAVPTAAIVGVLTRYALEKYLESPLYKGLDRIDFD